MKIALIPPISVAWNTFCLQGKGCFASARPAHPAPIYQGKKCFPPSLEKFGRSCSLACKFCAVSAYFKKQQYSRAMEEPIQKIKNQPCCHILFVDDNLVANHQAAEILFNALIPLKILWVFHQD